MLMKLTTGRTSNSCQAIIITISLYILVSFAQPIFLTNFSTGSLFKPEDP